MTRPLPSRRPGPARRPRLRPALLPALLLFLALAPAACGGGEPPSAVTPAAAAQSPAAPAVKEQPAVPVQVAVVAPVRLEDVLTLPGKTLAISDVTISAERGGPVEWIGPKEGDAVAKGEVIARVDTAALAAELSRAKAAYDLAAKQAQRRQELRSQGVLSTEELDKANNDHAAADSDLKQAQVDLEHGLIRSPVDGTINDLMVDPGEYVAPGDPVAEIVDIRRIEVEMEAPELDVRYLNAGTQARVTVDAYPDAVWAGQVTFVAYKADETTKTFRVKVLVDNADGRIRPGMLARVSVLRRVVEDAVTAPLHALVDRGGERLVYVVTAEGKALGRPVQIGVIGADRVQIVSGLEPGDRLIVSGQNAVEDGMRVEVR
ncbi:MAG: efflux RND transporter periplasmic adaptor subunit [Desulfovibrionaceae bacterium]